MTISSDLAVRLWHLKVKQRSRLYWLLAEKRLVSLREAEIWVSIGKAASAFMIDELVDLLPSKVSIFKDTDGYRARYKKFEYVAYDVNLAECLGKLLANLVEKKII